MRKRVISLMIATSMIATMLAGCGNADSNEAAQTVETNETEEASKEAAAPEGDIIKFAVVAPFTGTMAQYGEADRDGFQLAVEQINAAGGITAGGKTYQVEVELFDDKGTGEEASSIAEKVAADSSIIAVGVNSYSSGVAMVGSPIYEQYGIPALSPSASHPDYSSIGEYIFRNNLTDEIECMNAIQIPVSRGAKKLGILCMTSDFGESFEASTRKTLDALSEYTDCELACVSYFTEDTVDYSPNVAEFIDAGCDFIICSAEYTYFAQFIIQYRKVDKDTQLMGLGTCFDQDLINLAGDNTEGTFVASNFDINSSSQVTQDFVAAYREKYDSDPNFLSAQAYDNCMMLKEAIEKADSIDKEAIKDALYEVSIDGTEGSLSFDENGDALKVQVMFQIKDGKFEGVENAFDLWSNFEKRAESGEFK